MAAGPHVAQLSSADRQLLKTWLQEFDDGWHAGRLAEQVSRLPAQGPLRRAALFEFIKRDMAQRWKRGRRPTLDTYLKHYPELGPPESAPPELLQAELEVKRRFGTTARPGASARGGSRQPAGSGPGASTKPPAQTRTEAARTQTMPPLSAAAPPPEVPMPSPMAAPQLPPAFGRYRIVRKLGEGGMGAVHLAYDRELDREVALKTPLFGLAEGPEDRERFFREARTAATIQHPNVCPVYDVGEINGVRYVTMAYIEGQPLSTLIQTDKPLPQRPVAALIRKLALALHEAHRKGIVHRDLKPSNIMIDQRNEPVIVDFGLARRERDARLTSSGMVMGTPAYMPPEQARGDLDASGPACDIYSLGVILYELLTGRAPFVGPVSVVVAQLLTQEPPRPGTLRADLDPELESICLKAMARQAGERFGSMGEFAEALLRFLKKGAAHRPPAQSSVTQSAGPGSKPVAEGSAAAADKTPTSIEGLATQLLAQLARRADGGSDHDRTLADSTGRGRASRWVALLIAVAALGLAAAVAVAVLTRDGPRAVASATVSVRLVGVQEASEPGVIFLLNGSPIRPEQLTQAVVLEVGVPHELVARRGDEIVSRYRFQVDQQHDGDEIALLDPQVPVRPRQPGPGDFEWDETALARDFDVTRRDVAPDRQEIAWLLVAKRDIDIILRHEAHFYDDADVRMNGERTLEFEPARGIKRDEKVRARLRTDRSSGDVLKRSRRIVVVVPGGDPRPGGDRQSNPRTPPARVEWDETALAADFEFTRRDESDPDHVVWLLVAKRDIPDVGFIYWGYFYGHGTDNVRIDRLALQFEPSVLVKRGDNVRARLPKSHLRNNSYEQSHRIVINIERPSRGGR